MDGCLESSLAISERGKAPEILAGPGVREELGPTLLETF